MLKISLRIGLVWLVIIAILSELAFKYIFEMKIVVLILETLVLYKYRSRLNPSSLYGFVRADNSEIVDFETHSKITKLQAMSGYIVCILTVFIAGNQYVLTGALIISWLLVSVITMPFVQRG
jgi:hypothetical protein